MECKIGIIIPAYKIQFINQTFQSIQAQTNKNFNLYVFDDCSPYEIKDVFDKYFTHWSNAYYHRFDDNLGKKNLVSHWNRCLDNVKEEWVWLFSDDDMMTPTCVDDFYNTICFRQNIVKDVLRFNWKVIDENNVIVHSCNEYEQDMTATEYFYRLFYLRNIDARLQEFIFRSKKLKEIGGFLPFDFAWRSDNATVMSMTYPNNIHTISGNGEVLWRLSTVNISGAYSKDSIVRKNFATIEFFNWVENFYKKNNENIELSKNDLFYMYATHLIPINGCLTWKHVIDLSFKSIAIDTIINWVRFIYVFHVFKNRNNC